MGINRSFSATCDTCSNHRDGEQAWVSCLKDDLKDEGWRVGNKLKCPACLGDDPDYWANEDGWMFQ